MKQEVRLLITCEHGGNRIPAGFAAFFSSRAARRLLNGHRGWDAGALPLAQGLARRFKCPLYFSRVSRLLVDLNRSEGHPRIFSNAIRFLAAPEREKILDLYYRPHRKAIEDHIQQIISGRPVTGPKNQKSPCLHIAVHSFTPILGGKKRSTDIGLLYDPGRPWERSVANRWKASLQALLPDLRISLNAPYRGTSDGLTKSFRVVFSDSDYAGLELEINQSHLTETGRFSKRIQEAVFLSLRSILSDGEPGHLTGL